ncbi:hypothetical protein P7K49_008766 [Saguinus oedipus]|uniref:Uncharacterized protein n=1 Tax=Saguinus oedipus TaxID=9490 RepID=A0ABQ9VYM9_SAGOE|nr:hypothetical protein P7K49_008766 [Saguinus oedipus]
MDKLIVDGRGKATVSHDVATILKILDVARPCSKDFKIHNPEIALLNVELELKAEKDNADIRVHTAEDYQAIVDAEWNILYDKLEGIHYSGAHIVLSELPTGDMATSTFLTETCSLLVEYLRRI